MGVIKDFHNDLTRNGGFVLAGLLFLFWVVLFSSEGFLVLGFLVDSLRGKGSLRKRAASPFGFCSVRNNLSIDFALPFCPHKSSSCPAVSPPCSCTAVSPLLFLCLLLVPPPGPLALPGAQPARRYRNGIYDCVQVGGSVICSLWPCR